MLQFILGEAGTGKSTLLIDKIGDYLDAGEKDIYLIVPEQYSFESDKLVYETLGAQSFNSIKILSFSRLAKEILTQYGGIAGMPADDTIRLLTMSLAIDEVRDGLSIYAGQSKNTSFCNIMLDTVKEFKTAAITPEDFENTVPNLAGTLEQKASEISLIYTAYNAMLEEVATEQLDFTLKAAEIANEKKYFKDAVVFIDEYKSFTADEIELIKPIISQSREVFVSLCTDSGKASRLSLFSVANDTKNKLKAIAVDNDVDCVDFIRLKENKRFTSSAITHVSSHIFRPIRPRFKGENDGVYVVEANDIHKEIEFVCAEIRRLIKEEDYSFNNIAIIGRDINIYNKVLESEFEKYEIPYFMDMRESVLNKSLIMFIISVFEASSLNTAAILRLLKTGFIGMSIEDISLLENYCFRWNVKGEMWESDFISREHYEDEKRQSMQVKQLEKINGLREQVAIPLLKFRDNSKNATGAEISLALFKLMQEFGVEENVSLKIKLYMNNGREDEARELRQLWDILINSLDAMYKALENRKTSRTRFSELLRLILSKSTSATPPQTLDAVIVGSAERIRVPSLKVVFLIGVNEGILPYANKSGGLFSEKERYLLRQNGLEIFCPDSKAQNEERFIAYQAASTPSDKLYISYSLMDISYKTQLPSYMVKQITEMLNEDCVIRIAALDPQFFCMTGNTAFQTLAQIYKQDSPLRASLIKTIGNIPSMRHKLKYLELASTIRQHKIENEELMSRLLGKNVKLSPTRLEDFHKCKFMYFCKYGLRIRPLNKVEINPLESGNIIHHILQHIMQKHGKDFTTLTYKTLVNEVNKITQTYLEEKLGGQEYKSKRFLYLYRQLVRTSIKIIQQLQEEFMQSEFIPAGFEVDVGEDAEIKPIEVRTIDGRKIIVEGKIDRVDIMEKDGHKFVRVVDYKTGSKQFNLNDIYYGLNMQMLLYLFAIWNQDGGSYSNILPAGVLYLPAREPEGELSRRADESNAEAEAKKQFKMNGLVLDMPEVIEGMEKEKQGIFIPVRVLKQKGKDGEDKYSANSSLISLERLSKLNKHAVGLIENMADELLKGKIEASPVSGDGYSNICSYCNYKSVCANDGKTDIRTIKKLTNDELFKSIDEEGLHE